MSRKSPKHARPTVRRGAAAAGAIAATAAMTIAAPTGAASAATTPTGNAQIDALLAAAPILPGTLTGAGIVAVSPQIDKLIAQYNQIPGLSGLVPVTNQEGAILAIAGVPTIKLPAVPPLAPLPTTVGTYPYAPTWTGAGLDNTVTVGAPLGLGKLTNVTYGILGSNGAGAGSIGGNATTLDTVLGSFGVNNSVAITTSGGLTTVTPTLGGGFTAPSGLGSAGAQIVPVAVTYGDKTFLVGLPAVNLGFTGPLGTSGNLALNLGQIGVKDGKLVFIAPTIGASLVTPLGGGALNTFGGGGVTLGTDGLHVTTPGISGNVAGPGNLLNVSTTVGVGSFNATTAGVNYVAPTVAGSANTPLGNATTSLDGGQGSITPNGASFTSPSGSVTASNPQLGVSGTGGVTPTQVSVNQNGASVTGSNVSGTVNTPVGGGSTHVNTGNASINPTGTSSVNGPSGDATLNGPAGTGSVSGNVATGNVTANPGAGTGSVTGPSGGVHETSGGQTHGVDATTGSAGVDNNGPHAEPPSVSAH